MSFGKYQFLAWSRRGIARSIIEKDTLGKSAGSAIERAKIPISVKINNNTDHSQEFDLIGPADVTGIQNKMIVRTEPLNGISDFEPNVLPYVEFYDEDFPWRYTPASATGPSDVHLRPWLCLVVLKENEFVDTKRREPLPSIKVDSVDHLPPPEELHLWAHMHSNLPHQESDFETFLDKLESDVVMDPDGVYSRLLCPRKLDPKALYHAFLVPSYETGRLAGLGRPTSGVMAQQHSFAADLEFPVYYRWYFRTGKNFDFEYLVKLLKPRAMDERVGVRPMDCSKPAFIQADKKEEVAAPVPEIMLLEGAVKAPQSKSTKFPPDNTPQPFFEQIEKLINLNRLQEEKPDEDPFVSIPYYGMYHAMRKDTSSPGKRTIPEFIANSTNWYNDLNRDPRTRVPAGFGMRMVQQNQEKFMDIAWKQLGDVLEANKAMNLAQFVVNLMQQTFNKNVITRPSEDLLSFTGPLASRILDGETTVKVSIEKSLLAGGIFQTAFKRLTRNKTSLLRNLKINDSIKQYGKVVKSMNKVNGIGPEIKVNFQAHPALRNLTAFEAPPASVNNIKVWSMQSNLDPEFVHNLPAAKGGVPEVKLWNNKFDLNILIGTTIPPVTGPSGPIVTGPAGPIATPSGTPVISQPSTPIIFGSGTPALSTGPLANLLPPAAMLSTTRLANNTVSTRVQTKNVKAAYTAASFRFAYRDTQAPQTTLRVASIKNKITDRIQPIKAYKKLLDARIIWPAGILKKEEFIPAMAYPDIPDPAYKYLIEIDEEFLLPNLRLIPPNTLSLLRTNQKFIEAYMMGLNYEMGKELLWREYPTDMRGSYFRQFWDVSGFVTPNTAPKDAESLKDIDPIHKWPNRSNLGKHNKRDKEGDPEQLVFVIKGDLLKKFPNTVIYAQKALKDGEKKKILTDLSNESTYKKHVRFPLYQAEIQPDIKLLGFDLTIAEASGDLETPGFNDLQGWFFVIAEVPGEPHFGMDITFNPNVPGDPTWNDLSWENFDPDLPFVKSDVIPKSTGNFGGSFAPPNDPKTGVWGKTSADMASILFQRPVMVAIHATEMLDVKVDVPGIEGFHTLKSYSTLKAIIG